jgi:hypothetical protein
MGIEVATDPLYEEPGGALGSVASVSCEPGIKLGAVIAGGAPGEVVSGDPLPGGDLLERLNRLAPEVLGGSTGCASSNNLLLYVSAASSVDCLTICFGA